MISPIIVKLPDTFEKQLIFKSLHNFKAFTEIKYKDNTPNQKQVFISEHLSREFQKHKKFLMPQFKTARKEGKITYWKAEDGALLHIAFSLAT